jgi:hypothetical protein
MIHPSTASPIIRTLLTDGGAAITRKDPIRTVTLHFAVYDQNKEHPKKKKKNKKQKERRITDLERKFAEH